MCGHCHELGHGVNECGNDVAILNLLNNRNYYLNKPYTGQYIDYSQSDIEIAHQLKLNCYAKNCHERNTSSHQKIFKNIHKYVDELPH